MEFTIIQKLITVNHNSNVRATTKGIVLHSTATPGATDEMEAKYFSVDGRKASAHAFVDWDSVTQLIPWGEIAWHAGQTANAKYIGVELCEPAGNDVERFMQTWKRGVWLFAHLFVNLLHQYIITKENLPCHAEISEKYKESNHQDPIAYFAKYHHSVDAFRNDVQAKVNDMLFDKAIAEWHKRGVIGDVEGMRKEFYTNNLTPNRMKSFMIKSYINIMKGGV